MAMFLGIVMPKHKACIFHEKPEGQPTYQYPEASEEEEELNRCAVWVNEQLHENLDDDEEEGVAWVSFGLDKDFRRETHFDAELSLPRNICSCTCIHLKQIYSGSKNCPHVCLFCIKSC